MTQPTAYTKTTNFASDEANNVGGRSTVRTSNLDAEFDNIALTLRQTLQNLARIQRDDGQLTDGLVELYNLSTVARLSLQTAFNPRGAWIASTSYAAGDLIEQNASSYICIVAHSSTVFATDYAAGKWQVLFSSGMVSVADYTALRTYNGTEKSIQVTGYLVGVAPSGFAGTFTRDDGDTTSAENGGTIIVASNGTRWKRVYSGGVDVRWFGAVGDGTNHQLSAYFASLAAAQAIYPHVTALTQSIDWAAFQAAHNSLGIGVTSIGGEIAVPATKYGYYLSDTLQIRKRVTVRGANRGEQQTTSAARLIFPPNTTGIRLYSVLDPANGTSEGADFSNLKALNLWCNNKAGSSTGHGIESTCAIVMEDVVARDFAQHGVYVHGQTGTGAYGNVDCSRLVGVRCVTNGGDGIHLNGNDANVITLINCSCANNAGYGYYDNAAYCNTYIGCHEAGNTTGSYYNLNSTGLGGVYVGCYQEGGSAGPNFSASTLVIGGVMATSGNCGQGINLGGGNLNFNVPTGNRHIFTRNNVEVGRIDNDNTLRNFPGAKFGTGSNYIDLTNSAIGRVDLSQSITTSSQRMSFINGNGTVGSVSTNGSATAFNTSSDERLKQDIIPAPGASVIDSIPVMSFRWKADGTAVTWGGIAQQLHAAVGEQIAGLVHVGGDDEKTEPWAVDWSKAVPPLIKYCQELKAAFDSYVAAHP